MVITTLQLVQMIVGCLVNVWVIQMKQDGLECHVSDQNIKLSLLMYASYFVLFGQFFYNAYVSPPPAKKAGGVGVKAKQAASEDDGIGGKGNNNHKKQQ